MSDFVLLDSVLVDETLDLLLLLRLSCLVGQLGLSLCTQTEEKLKAGVELHWHHWWVVCHCAK